MELEVETRQNTRDIATLTTNVVRLTTIVEGAETRHIEDRQTMREVFVELKQLNEKIGGVTAMQAAVNELASQSGSTRHDIRNLDQAMQGIPLVQREVVENAKKIVDHEARVKALESVRDKQVGATGAVKIFIHVLWAVFGSGVTALGLYFLSDFFKHNPPHEISSYAPKP